MATPTSAIFIGFSIFEASSYWGTPIRKAAIVLGPLAVSSVSPRLLMSWRRGGHGLLERAPKVIYSGFIVELPIENDDLMGF
jgi:hypothetical protein